MSVDKAAAAPGSPRRSGGPSAPSLLAALSWPELRHHGWRTAAALVAVMLGVALAYSVHLVNASALDEFSAAVRAVGGEPDLRIGGPADGFDERLYAKIASDPRVALASPVVEGETFAFDAEGRRVPIRIVGIDALAAPALAPALALRPSRADDRYAALDPGALFVNAEASRRLGPAASMTVQTANGRRTLRVAGSVATGGPAMAAMDIAGAQVLLGRLGRLSRVDVRLVAGADAAALVRALALPPGVRSLDADDAVQRASNVSRAYRVNLTVLALVAMFTGAFLVYSIQALSVARRQQQLALLGVLGLSARGRLWLVVAESAAIGVGGSVLGLTLGAGLAALALRQLGGDLGGGYFSGASPTLRIGLGGLLVHGALGVAAAIVGGFLPARAAARLAPAQALKGLGAPPSGGATLVIGAAAIVAGVGMALLPPIAGLPLAAYASVALLLLGGIACVPGSVALLLAGWREPTHPLALLAVERARHERSTATIAVAGVVASLALAVALTVMVTSFRDAVVEWLDVVLPADLYVRAAAGAGGGDVTALPPSLADATARLPGVRRVDAQRVVSLAFDTARPPVVLIARPLRDPSRDLPITGDVAAAVPGRVGVFVSEAMVDLYGARVGKAMPLPLPSGGSVDVLVRGVWRDYARQFGAVAIDASDWRRLSGDSRINDLAVWLEPQASTAAVQAGVRRLAGEAGFDEGLVEFASPREIRAASLRIFDRSFAVTYWLQAVAIGIGLFGVAASFSAQVLARRKEFGLLTHLGFSRRQVLAVVAGEAAAWSAAGAALGVVLGIAVSVVLVDVVNPQSFHWTMALVVPWVRVAALAAAVVVASTLTAAVVVRRASGRDAALAVREDW